MSSVVISGNTSGAITLSAPDVAGTTTLTLPATSGTVLTSTSATVGSGGITFSDGSTQTAAASPYVLKNRIINGAMVIDQRNAGASVTATTGIYTLDRWQAYSSPASKFTIQQNAGSVTPPAGFTNYLGITSSSAYSSGSTDFFSIYQWIEGFNVADLGWGTANAKTVTLSFQVYSSLTGTFGGALINSAQNRSYPYSYTISSANTWTTVSVTIAGDTSGTWLKTNGQGIGVLFDLGSGSTYKGTAGSWAGTTYYSATGATSVVGTNGATFYITGVQLEIGTSATPFERRMYTTEFQLCQRYYQKLTGRLFVSAYVESATLAIGTITLPVTMRIAPTSLDQSGTAADYNVRTAGAGRNCSAVPSLNVTSPDNVFIAATVASGLSAGQAGNLSSNSTAGFLGWSAEL